MQQIVDQAYKVIRGLGYDITRWNMFIRTQCLQGDVRDVMFAYLTFIDAL